MKTNKKIKNLLCYIVAFMLAIVANLGFGLASKPSHTIYAANNTSPISVNNSTFSNKDSKNQPKNFTATTENNNIDARVVNVTTSEINSKYPNIVSTLNPDNNVLMIDSGKNVATYGYKTEKDLTIKKDCIYSVSVSIFTANGGAAHIELASEDKTYAQLSNIVSNGGWTRYYLFVKNNDLEDVNAKLGIYLKNSSGVVMFDNISAKQINDNELNTYIQNPDFPVSRYSYVNRSTNLVKEFDISEVAFTSMKTESNSKSTSAVVYDTDGEHEKAFKIVNNVETYTTFETTQFSSTNKYIEFNQNSVYKVSLNVKAENLSGKATIKLLQVVDGEKTATDGSIDITKNTAETGNIKNDYKTYSFYVKSSPNEISKYKLAIEFGTQTAKASGSISISNIEITSITTEIYSSATDSNSKQIDLTSTYSEHSSMIKNGNFDLISVSNHTNQYPATPNDWDVATGKHTQYYGVVNTSDTEFNKLPSNTNIVNPTNPNFNKDNSNVLMLHNTEADTLSYTSSAKTNLAAKSIHKFQTMIQTHNGPATLSLITKKDGKEVVLSSISVDTEYAWETVEMFVKIGYQPTDISLKVTLDSESWATAYVYNARMDYTSAPTEEQFNSKAISKFVSKIDLTQILGLGTDFMFSGEENNNVSVKIVEISADPKNYAITIDSYLSETYHKITSTLGFKLNSGTRYKISVDVSTKFISTENEEADFEKLGAGIKLTSFEDSFTAIKTNDDEWSTYTFYINPNSSTTAYLELMLGDKDNILNGNVRFANIKFVEDVNETEFNNAKESEWTKILNTVVEDPEDDKKDSSNEDEEKPEINWFYFASSIIFALAIVICVVGVMLKKVKFKKPTKKTKNAYDRNKTVSKQYYTRKATTMREEKIRELEKDLETLHAERAEFEENYKKDLVKLRELKIKRASANEIKQLEKDMKKNQRLAAGIGLTINKARQDLDYAKTDAYLQSLIRKLQTQQTKENLENK